MITRIPSSKVSAPALAAASAIILASCATTDDPVSRAEVVGTTSAIEPGLTTVVTEPVPATPVAAPDFSERQMVEYTVVQGDSLWKIGRDKEVSIADIQAANNMTDTVIRTGDTILLPLKGAAAPAPVPATGPATFQPGPATLTPTPGTTVAPTPPVSPTGAGNLAPPPPPPAPTAQ